MNFVIAFSRLRLKCFDCEMWGVCSVNGTCINIISRIFKLRKLWINVQIRQMNSMKRWRLTEKVNWINRSENICVRSSWYTVSLSFGSKWAFMKYNKCWDRRVSSCVRSIKVPSLNLLVGICLFDIQLDSHNIHHEIDCNYAVS